MPRIAVYAICKNESDFAERFYNSVKASDYIVILDTGSTDNTYDKLKQLAEYDDRLIISQKTYEDWRFDTARNDAMDLCPADTDIFVSVDLDEIFNDGWVEELKRNWIIGKHTRAEYWYVWSHNADGSAGRKFRYNKVHDKNWRWKYPVHELLANIETDSESYYTENTLALSDNVILHHYPDMSKSRTSYLPLLEKRYNEYGDHYGMFYLGHEYFYRGKYESCIEMLTKVKLLPQCSNLDRASCELFIGDSYYAMQQHENAENAYLRAISEDYTYFEPYYYLGKMYNELQRYTDSIGVIKKGIHNRVRHYSWTEREEPWYYGPWDILSLSCYYSGHYNESLAYATKASYFCPDEKRLKRNIELIIQNVKDSQLL